MNSFSNILLTIAVVSNSVSIYFLMKAVNRLSKIDSEKKVDGLSRKERNLVKNFYVDDF